MTPKIVVYFLEQNEPSYRIFRSLEGMLEILSDQSKWPVFADLSFEPSLSDEVCGILKNLPCVAYLSQSLIYANLPKNCTYLLDRSVKVQRQKAYPILSFSGQGLITEQEVSNRGLIPITEHQQGSNFRLKDEAFNKNISIYEFSVRTTNVFENLKVIKLSDLFALSEQELLNTQNFGRGCLEEVQFFLKKMGVSLGLKSGDACRIDWEKFNRFHDIDKENYNLGNSYKSKTDRVFDLHLANYEMSVRSSQLLDHYGIVTVRDLLAFSKSELLKTPNFGRKSLLEIETLLDEMGLRLGLSSPAAYHIDQPKMEKFVSGVFGSTLDHDITVRNDDLTTSESINSDSSTTKSSNIVESFVSLMSGLEERQRQIIGRRMGLNNPAETLEEISEDYGVTRERIRQIESKAIKWIQHPARGWNTNDIWSEAFKKAFETTSHPLSTHHLAIIDQRFDCQEFGERCLTYILTRVLSKDVDCFLVKFNENKYYSRMHQDAIDDVIANVKTLLPKLEGKSLSEVSANVRGVIPELVSEFSQIILDIALENSVIEEVEGEEYLQVYSPRRTALVVAKNIFQKIDKPITNDEFIHIIERDYPDFEPRNVINRLQDLPGVFPFRHGVWGSVKLLGLDRLEMLSLDKAIKEFLKLTNKDQFHSKEVYSVIEMSDPELAKKIDSFRIAGLIRHFKSAEYLGRNMFAKHGSGTGRIQLRELIINILSKNQAPMNNSNIRDEVKKIRSFEGNLQVFTKPPIVSLTRGYFGLESWNTRVTEDGIFYKTDRNMKESFVSFAVNKSKGKPSRTWSEEDIKILLELRSQGLSVNAIAAEMSLTQYAVRSAIKQIEVKEKSFYDHKIWTEQKVDDLRLLWRSGVTIVEIANRLEIPTSEITSKILILKLPERTEKKVDQVKELSITEKRILEMHKQSYKVSVISKILKITPEQIYETLRRLNPPSKVETQVLGMYDSSYSPEIIAKIIKLPLEEVKSIIEKFHYGDTITTNVTHPAISQNNVRIASNDLERNVERSSNENIDEEDRWSDRDIRRLIQLKNDGYDASVSARILGKKVYVVEAKLKSFDKN